MACCGIDLFGTTRVFLRYQNRHHLSTYLRTAFWTLLLGSLLFAGIYALVIDRFSWSDMGWHAARNGSLCMVLWLVNGYLSDSIPISWTTQTRARLLVTILGTVVGTLGASTLLDVFFDGLQFGHPEWGITRWHTGFHFSVLVITAIISLFLHGRSFLLEYRQAIEEKEALKRAGMAPKPQNPKTPWVD